MRDPEPMTEEDLLLVIRMRDMVAGGLVREVRAGAGLSLAEVARVVGVVPSTVFHWERGHVPRGDPAIRYARLLRKLEKVGER